MSGREGVRHLKLRERLRSMNIQVAITLSFTAIAMAGMILLSMLLYRQFAQRLEQSAMDASEKLIGQAVLNLEDYLRGMRQVSDTMTYSAIKDTDLQEESLENPMRLLYQTYIDDLVSIACYDSQTGELVAATPVASPRENADVASQEWFESAKKEPENFHFSAPHVQNLFDDPTYQYYWVISLSRSVELNSGGTSSQGILLVDMRYSSVVSLLDKVNANESGGYLYLADSDGSIICHPRQALMRSGAYQENNRVHAGYDDGTFTETYGGSKRLVTVKTVAYTGWKMIHVVPMSSYMNSMDTTRYLIILVLSIAILVVMLVNQFVSSRITMPLRKLDASVAAWEAGSKEPSIYIGGSAEVEHLGRTLDAALKQTRQLMEHMVVEQEEKRKSELDALQSQINPHFLYNTLDSVVWMITGGRTKEAVFMIKQLASLFRISLSKGFTIIRIADEINHAQYYMNIQKIRYRNDFTVTFDISEEILSCCTVKLIVQPILENAIYYAMEYMDDEGEIHVKGWRDGEDIYIDIEDNGPGMPEKKAAELLTNPNHERTKGSGVGLVNVHSRIQLRFGAEYGLEIQSFPDEGTRVRIHLPYIPFTEENQKALEQAKWRHEQKSAPEKKEGEA